MLPEIIRRFRSPACAILFATIVAYGCGDGDDNGGGGDQPSGVVAVNGDHYIGVMGSSFVEPGLEFRVLDDNSDPLPDQWVVFSRPVGDGSFVSDSAKSDSAGQVTAEYVFDGQLGHAQIMAKVRGVDSVTVDVRANTIIPGSGGQAQYILFDDTYADVIAYNGLPENIGTNPSFYILYAEYLVTEGVVFAFFEDTTLPAETIADTARPKFIILTADVATYPGKTRDSIGLGSTLPEVRAAFGPPDTVYSDAFFPPINIPYSSEGMILYGATELLNGIPVADTIVHEIHISDPNAMPSPVKLSRIQGTAARR